jgi:hypothetical protein
MTFSDDIILLFAAAIVYALAFVFLIYHLKRGFPLSIKTPYNFTFAVAFGVTLIALGIRFYLLTIR